MGELVLEPAGHHVDGEAAAGQVIGRRAQLGQHGRLPQSRVDGRDHLEPLRGQQQRQAEAGRLVLVLGAVAGLIAHLAQRVVEPVLLRRLGQLDVVVVAPVGALLDVAGDQSATDIGHPVRELDVVGDPFGCHGVPSHQQDLRPSRVTLALTESQTSTIGVAEIPLKRDDVTDVYAPINGLTTTSPTFSAGIG